MDITINGKNAEKGQVSPGQLFLYSIILANNPDNFIDWDEFIDALDNDKALIAELNKLVEDYQSKDSIFEKVDTTSGEKKS